MGKPRVIYWFRTDLRLHDSPALKAALDLKPECLYPIWTWDPHYVYRARVGPNRWQFLLDCQNDLSASITKLNKKSKLHVIREAPQTLFPKLWKAWKISHLVFEKDTDSYARSRDEEVIALAKKAGVEVIVKTGRTLFDPDELVKQNRGKPTMSMNQVQHAGETLGEPARPIDAPQSLPDPGDTKLDFDQEQPASDPDVNAVQRDQDEKSYASGLAGPKGDFSVPTLEEIGIKNATSPHRGGETRALKGLDEIIKDEDYTATFAKPNTAPTDFEPQSTTLLSPHLHFGSLSCRLFYWRAQDVISKYGSKATQPPTSLTGQLLFRDMYFGAQAALGHTFAQTVGNPNCRFVPWHLPSRVQDSSDRDSAPVTTTNAASGTQERDYQIDSPEAEEYFRRWKHGITGFPWIDALMRQLRHDGWIHHLGRHAVACFLTRGGCYVSWERGASVFEEWLIDHEVACNIGNWQWLSCTAFYAQFYRCYSPVAFPRKWDKEGRFVRKWVPEMADVPEKYVYEPWKAPIQDLKKAGVMLKKGAELGEEEGGSKVYPKPMFDFNDRRQICIDGLKQAYDVGLYGNDPKVLDGSWRKLFPDDAEGPTKGKKGGIGGMIEDDEEATGEEEFDDVQRKGEGEEGSAKKKSENQGGASPKPGRKRKENHGSMEQFVKRSKK
ncbi:cryptochrome-2 [Viridothelium virens]|uniref:Cryptochrome-2 n=1 Tax=Viridothelium virens TaxID=1048519 RepID=A0A6A6H5F3_VIRVR|nr:cryptochrome-2 [Viridothelium virens]